MQATPSWIVAASKHESSLSVTTDQEGVGWNGMEENKAGGKIVVLT
jgi:hypothetical protein